MASLVEHRDGGALSGELGERLQSEGGAESDGEGLGILGVSVERSEGRGGVQRGRQEVEVLGARASTCLFQ